LALRVWSSRIHHHAQKYPSTLSLKPGEVVEGMQHRLVVMDALRQPTFAQSPAEIAGITGKDDIARGPPYSERLVTRRVP
jgi:hypothetical protein